MKKTEAQKLWREISGVLPTISRAEFNRLLERDAMLRAAKANQGGLLRKISAVLYRHDMDGRGKDEWQHEAASLISQGLGTAALWARFKNLLLRNL